ncbi:hypothetical protein TcasGA2_TC004271 [Tribolium castaneum]|uniref:Retrotransposon gag domain-containing protein n=1 Tax=Tribolium castaneum TaxID=7070 RepID=D7EKN8_TRICA|nr:hypothetical protein TcasGA2_TC004271 [Tribolium castaneum]
MLEDLKNRDEATEKRKIALLLNLIGEDAQELMNNFVWATAEERGNFRAVVNKFKDYCQPLKNITIERFNFNSIVQREGETFDSFVTELQNKVATCEFGTLKEGLIRDRIVYGIRDKALQKRLLREPNLLLADCIQYCRAALQSERQAQLFKNGARVEAVKKEQVTKKTEKIKWKLKTDEADQFQIEEKLKK